MNKHDKWEKRFAFWPTRMYNRELIWFREYFYRKSTQHPVLGGTRLISVQEQKFLTIPKQRGIGINLGG